MPEINLIVQSSDTNQRLDAYLASKLEFSRSEIERMITNKQILVNDLLPNKKDKTILNDHINIKYEEMVDIDDIKAENIPLDIVYEDSDLIVINKAKGMVTHPAPGNHEGTLVNALLYHCKQLSDQGDIYRPGIVHRLDKDTSGLIVCAKNNKAHRFLSDQLKDKSCYRKYIAIVKGVIEHDQGEINAPIGRNKKDRQKMEVTNINSKEAITEFKVLERYDDATLVDITLKTGRTHQIRVHFKYINHPVLNDPKYYKKIDDTGQYLHAYYLSFIHPTTLNRVAFQTKIPEYMLDYISKKGGKFNGFKS